MVLNKKVDEDHKRTRSVQRNLGVLSASRFLIFNAVTTSSAFFCVFDHVIILKASAKEGRFGFEKTIGATKRTPLFCA